MPSFRWWFTGNLLMLALLLCAGCQVHPPGLPTPQEVEQAFEPHVVVDPKGQPLLRYRILKPARLQPGRKYPLVLVLHGAGERGDDNVKQLTHGARQFLAYTRSRPAFVVFPQCPKGTWWDGPSRYAPETQQANVVPPLRQVIALIDRLLQQFPIDRSRLYVTGLSMGGYGTHTIVAARPDLFAAALPICGGGDPRWVSRYRYTSFLVIHGQADQVISVEVSRQ
ncbi:MAG: prolyl oligopeptidase family serine peptidase, partial [Phycisphaerae bacterium]|nr:prolyl oligopeptidase family serine peptidase [Phycisphaerae bacterium]